MNSIKKMCIYMSLLILVGTPFFSTALSIFSFATEDTSVKRFENDAFVLYEEKKETAKTIHWKFTYEKKQMFSLTSFAFLVTNEKESIKEEQIKEQTKEEYTFFNTYLLETNASSNTLLFETPKEPNWKVKVYEIKQDETPQEDYLSTEEHPIDESTHNLENAVLIAEIDLLYEKEQAIFEEESKPAESVNEREEHPSTEESLLETDDSIEKKPVKEPVEVVSGATTGKGELAPQHAILMTDIFDGMRSNPEHPSPFYSGVSGKNYYTGLQTFSEFGSNDPRKNRVYYLAGNENRMSVFSKSKYRLNFSKSFKGMAYVSFGINESDGMTFTLHNDSRGSGASGALNNSTNGGALGVYPDKLANFLVGQTFTANGALEHSLSIEFDMFYNTDPYDHEVPEQMEPHIALTYPSNVNEYIEGGLPGFKKYNVVHHALEDMMPYEELGYKNKVINKEDREEPVEINWNELEFSYDETTRLFLLELFLPTKKGRGKIWSTSIPYDRLNDELNLEQHDQKAYWGFTAANGSNSGMDGFAIGKLPLQFSVNNKVYKENSVDITLNSNQDNAEERHATFEEKIYLAGKVETESNASSVSGEIVELSSVELLWDRDVLPLENINALKLQKISIDNNQILEERSYTKEQLTEEIWKDNEDQSGKQLLLSESFKILESKEHFWVALSFTNGVKNENTPNDQDYQFSSFQLTATSQEGVSQSSPPAFFALKQEKGTIELQVVPSFVFGYEKGKTTLAQLHEKRTIPLFHVSSQQVTKKDTFFDETFPTDLFISDTRKGEEKNPLTLQVKFDFYKKEDNQAQFTPHMNVFYRKKEEKIDHPSEITDSQEVWINHENTLLTTIENDTKTIAFDFQTHLSKGLLDFQNSLLPVEKGRYQANVTWTIENTPTP